VPDEQLISGDAPGWEWASIAFVDDRTQLFARVLLAVLATEDVLVEGVVQRDLRELEPIKLLPGVPDAATATFDEAWRPGVNLSASAPSQPAALAALEQELVGSLPASMKRPPGPVPMTTARIARAPSSSCNQPI
jgi:hypothetical protein